MLRAFVAYSLVCVLLAWQSPAFGGGTLSERTFKYLTRAQGLMGEDKYDEAEDILLSLEAATKNKKYSNAIVSQTMGYLYSMQNKFGKAKEVFARAIDSGELPDEPLQSLRANLARLYIADQETEKALPLMAAWFETHEGDPNAGMHVLYGSAYAQLRRYPPAIEQFELAVEIAEEPKQDWVRLLAAMHATEKNYPRAIHYLEILVTMAPEDKRAWKQLSGMYMAQEQDKNALNALSTAYQQGLLTEGKEYENIANFFAYKGQPNEAGKALAYALDKGLSEPSYKLYRRLGNFWFQAKENDLAVASFLKALEYERSDKDVHRYLSSIYLEQEDWSALKSLLDPYRPDLDRDKGRRELMLGIATYRLGDTPGAKQALTRAKTYKKTASSARQWLAYIDDLNR